MKTLFKSKSATIFSSSSLERISSLKILDLSLVKDGISIGNIYHEKVIAIKFLVEIENDKVYLIYPTAHFRKYLKIF